MSIEISADTEHHSLPIREILTNAAQKINGTKATFLATLIIYLLIEGLGLIFHYLGSIFLLLYIISIIVMTLIQSSVTFMGVRAASGWPIRFSMMFSVLTLKKIGRLILFYLFMSLASALIMFVASFAMGVISGINPHLHIATISHEVLNLISAVFVIIGVCITAFVIIRIMLGATLIVAKNIATWTAIKMSWVATRGNFWKLIFLMLVVILTTCVGALTVIGIIWFIPYVMLIWGEVYIRLFGPVSETDGLQN